ncbi:MAG TPA: D-glucuronyl C5-epimerase family protein [Phnomibacter sp.]|nr:D-glucuronyl C5-epimerase family protein [Phnomibacter sp.]
MKRFIIIVILAAVAAALVCEKKGDTWEEGIRNALYATKGDSVPDFDPVTIDSLQIPFVTYATENGITAGKQYNATIVANYALDYYSQYEMQKDAASKTAFMHCAQWLLDTMSQKDGYALFEFHWQQPWYDSVKAPFTCGMTSGLTMEVFAKANQLQADTVWTNAIEQLLKGYEVPVEQGGFTFIEPTGYWYEEIADSAGHTPRILDGHIFALLGAKYVADHLKIPIAEGLFIQGLQSLKYYLPQYDAGHGAIYYDKYKKVADKKYQRLLIAQMQQLWTITGDSVYLKYHDEWKAPSEQPYVLRMAKQRNISGFVLFGCLLLSAFIVLVLLAAMFLKLRKRRK